MNNSLCVMCVMICTCVIYCMLGQNTQKLCKGAAARASIMQGWDLDGELMSHGLIKPKWAVMSIFSISSPVSQSDVLVVMLYFLIDVCF